jgi:hypothetical protein
MKKLMIAAMLGGQALAAAQPAFAAELAESRSQQTGAFAGLRVRMGLDGTREQRRLRAGLTVAPTLHSRSAAGETRLRFGEGVELGIVGGDKVRLSLAGTPVNRLAQGATGPDGRRLGVSTAGWVAIGIGATVAVLGVGYLVFTEMMDCDADEECS